MPKPVKKAVRKLKVPPKRKRPTDPNRAPHAAMVERLRRIVADEPEDKPPTFDDLYRARMAELGAKGGTVSGAKRMENLSDRKRKEIAQKGAAARWKKT